MTIGRARRIFKDGEGEDVGGGKIGERTPRYSQGTVTAGGKGKGEDRSNCSSRRGCGDRSFWSGERGRK